MALPIPGHATEGSLADRTSHRVLEGLRRAAAEPSGVSLHAGKGAPGLFPATSAGRLAAQRCKDEGYLRFIETPSNGKPGIETCAITEKGLAHLLRECDPRHLLEDLVRAIEGREGQLAELLVRVGAWQGGMADLRAVAERYLQAAMAGDAIAATSCGTPAHTILQSLTGWHGANTTEDCPLPELFRRVQPALPALTLGQFQDSLRSLKEQERIYLHPWTGPLYAMPEPACALLSGHEVAYYASLRHG